MKFSNTLEPLNLLKELQVEESVRFHLDWVPFINILLLIFALCCLSSRWLCPPSLQLHLPSVAKSVAYLDSMPVQNVLLIDANKRVFFNRNLYTQENLDELLQEDFQNLSLLVQVDESVPLDFVITILNKLYERGCQSVQMAVNTL